jgi:hypothetical protein
VVEEVILCAVNCEHIDRRRLRNARKYRVNNQTNLVKSSRDSAYSGSPHKAENQIVIDFEVYDQRPNEANLLIPAIEIHEAKLDAAPRSRRTRRSTPAKTRLPRKLRVSSEFAFLFAQPKAPSVGANRRSTGSARAKNGAQETQRFSQEQPARARRGPKTLVPALGRSAFSRSCSVLSRGPYLRPIDHGDSPTKCSSH